ncbi:Abi family protein [Macrococcoides caseolyticum]|uniref:Abi family protein n=1 Tax=Macrococcoides caseolyticum TaxID=69966 RepID=UPI0020B72286|nr:Abi family protein [Macrococcus caseolyticus]UTH05723.1 Abi family protein [Macrococcus caseolyticus]
MGIKLWKKREDLVDTLINQRNLKCSCPSYNICTCEVKINKFLKDINYFQLFNGLENILLSSNSPKDFGNVVSVEDFKRIYSFDRKLANEIFNLTNIFEEKLQNSISYHFSEAYCSSLNDTMQYTNKLNYKDISTDVNYPFSRDRQLYSSIIYNFNATDNRGNSKFKLFNSEFLDKLVKNNDMINQSFYRDNNYNAPSGVSVYSNDSKVAVPFWVAIQTFDFGTLRYLCHYLKDSEMNLVLNDFGLRRNQRNMFLSILDIVDCKIKLDN